MRVIKHVGIIIKSRRLPDHQDNRVLRPAALVASHGTDMEADVEVSRVVSSLHGLMTTGVWTGFSARTRHFLNSM